MGGPVGGATTMINHYRSNPKLNMGDNSIHPPLNSSNKSNSQNLNINNNTTNNNGLYGCSSNDLDNLLPSKCQDSSEDQSESMSLNNNNR
jgi:hypothetical protein